MGKRNYVQALAIPVTLAIGILLGTLFSNGVRAARESADRARVLPVASPVELSDSFARIADQVGPAVVNIKTETTVKLARGRHGLPDDVPEDLFDRFFHSGPNDPLPHEFPESSLGSGVILDPKGLILTNYHVVMRDGEDKPVDHMRVYLEGDDESAKGYPAHIVGTDKWTDLAVIRIDAGHPLASATLGDSDRIRVGDWALAIGSPFGLNSTVTAGIISAKGRGIEPGSEGEFKRFIQTDAAINPGNSGGPLVDLAGQVIGINTAIATNRDAYDGVGFAIPSNTVRQVYNSIVSEGLVRRGAIGVTFTNGKNSAVLRSFGADHGVVVDSVQPGSPAERAGLRLGDVITTVNSRPVADGDDLLGLVSQTAPGVRLRVDFLRDGKQQTTEVVVGDWNKIVGEVDRPPDPASDNAGQQSGGVLGVSVRALTSDQERELTRALGLSGPQGVLVTQVTPGGFADDLGLGHWDVILSLNRQPVTSVDDFNRLQSQLKSGDNVLLLVARRGGGSFTTLFLADRLP